MGLDAPVEILGLLMFGGRIPKTLKAGRYTGKGERFTRVTERDKLICVDVRGIASEVCHRTADVTVEK